MLSGRGGLEHGMNKVGIRHLASVSMVLLDESLRFNQGFSFRCTDILDFSFAMTLPLSISSLRTYAHSYFSIFPREL